MNSNTEAGTLPQVRIEAYFQPQAWINDYATDIDGGQPVDVTDAVLRLNLDRIHALVDYQDSTDALVDAAKIGHDGPFTVRVTASVEEFFGVQHLRDITQVNVIEARAMVDYEDVLGKTVLVSAICGFVGNDSVDINLDPPAKVRVEKTRETSVKRWNDDWCDPYWEVVLAEPHPQLSGVRSLWISGTCYYLDGQQTEPSDVVSVVEEAPATLSPVATAVGEPAGRELPVSVIPDRLLQLARELDLHVEGSEILWSSERGALCLDHWLTAEHGGITVELRMLRKEDDQWAPILESSVSEPITVEQAETTLQHWGLLNAAEMAYETRQRRLLGSPV
jgi:hypothetical protein